jgi:hypothetical protein
MVGESRGSSESVGAPKADDARTAKAVREVANSMNIV